MLFDICKSNHAECKHLPLSSNSVPLENVLKAQNIITRVGCFVLLKIDRKPNWLLP